MIKGYKHWFFTFNEYFPGCQKFSPGLFLVKEVGWGGVINCLSTFDIVFQPFLLLPLLMHPPYIICVQTLWIGLLTLGYFQLPSNPWYILKILIYLFINSIVNLFCVILLISKTIFFVWKLNGTSQSIWQSLSTNININSLDWGVSR